MIGALFICWPAGTFILLCRITGLVIIVSSIALFLTSGRNQNSLYRGGYRLMAVIAFVIGLWVMLAPILMVTVFPVIVGLILLFHGVRDLMRRIREKGARDMFPQLKRLADSLQAIEPFEPVRHHTQPVNKITVSGV